MAETTPCPQCSRPTVLTMTLADTRLRIDPAPSGQGVVIPVQVDGSWRSRSEDFPALFAAPAAKPPRVDVAERAAAPGGRKLSSAERIAQQVLQA